MNPMKRLGLAAALVGGVTLLASTPARAGKVADRWGPHELANVGDEPRASGKATLTDVVCTVRGIESGRQRFPSSPRAKSRPNAIIRNCRRNGYSRHVRDSIIHAGTLHL